MTDLRNPRKFVDSRGEDLFLVLISHSSNCLSPAVPYFLFQIHGKPNNKSFTTSKRFTTLRLPKAQNFTAEVFY